MDWRQRLSGCFGEVDHRFAAHPLDSQRAFELLSILRREQVRWEDVRVAVWGHLRTKGCTPQHITEQMKAVNRHFRPWLSS